jgi:uncharacterized protein YkwD
MRVIQSIFAAAIAALVLSASAQPADAALASNEDYGTGHYVDCSPDHSAGVHGQYGAWGSYVGGCTTVQVKCTTWPACLVSNRSTINTEYFWGNRVTLNTRIRFYNSAGALTGWRDKSCDGTNFCRAEDAGSTIGLRYNESATVQCNGVRQTVAGNRARAHCSLNITRSCAGATTPVTQLSQEAAEAAVLCLTNLERAKAGVAALAPHGHTLGVAARGHAAAAVANPWWDGRDPHRNPYTGSTAASRISAAGYCRAPKQYWVAENAYVGGPTPQDAVTWWMNSPGHRANILNPNHHDSGVGVVRGSADPRNRGLAGTFVQTFGGCINL